MTRTSPSKWTAIAWIALCWSHVLAAQNLISNPDFDAGLGLTSWVGTTGSWALDPDSGTCLLSDSAAGTSAIAGSDQFLGMYSQQCVPVDPVATPTLYLGGLYKTPASVWARLYLSFFSDGACTTFASWSEFAFGATSPTWRAILGPVSIPAGVGSVRVWADFNPMVAGLPQYTGSYDRIYLGAVPQLFADGFEAESGSACHWSDIVDGS